MELRIATPKDIAVIQQLRIKMLGEVAGDLPGNLPQAIFEYLNTHLQDGSCLCALIGADRNVVGKAMLCIYEVMPDEVNTTGQCAALFSVYTLPQFRGHGYMERLLRFLLEKAKDSGVNEILAAAEEKAIPLYQRIGFKIKGNEMEIRLEWMDIQEKQREILMKIYEVSERPAVLVQKLLQVWEKSVRATHFFLSDAEVSAIKKYVPQALCGIDHLLIAENEPGTPVAFMGIADGVLEMLFIAPEERGKGLGKQLIRCGIEHYGVERLAVNEQNPQAKGFYEHMGFKVYKRTDTDEQGNPYPLLYMQRG